MNEKSIIGIGAWIAGLSADSYGQMNGCRLRVFEQDTRRVFNNIQTFPLYFK